MISHGVEIRITQGVEEIVRAHLLVLFRFMCFIFVLRYNQHFSSRYGDKKPQTTAHPASFR